MIERNRALERVLILGSIRAELAARAHLSETMCQTANARGQLAQLFVQQVGDQLLELDWIFAPRQCQPRFENHEAFGCPIRIVPSRVRLASSSFSANEKGPRSFELVEENSRWPSQVARQGMLFSEPRAVTGFLNYWLCTNLWRAGGEERIEIRLVAPAAWRPASGKRTVFFEFVHSLSLYEGSLDEPVLLLDDRSVEEEQADSGIEIALRERIG